MTTLQGEKGPYGLFGRYRFQHDGRLQRSLETGQHTTASLHSLVVNFTRSRHAHGEFQPSLQEGQVRLGCTSTWASGIFFLFLTRCAYDAQMYGHVSTGSRRRVILELTPFSVWRRARDTASQSRRLGRGGLGALGCRAENEVHHTIHL